MISGTFLCFGLGCSKTATDFNLLNVEWRKEEEILYLQSVPGSHFHTLVSQLDWFTVGEAGVVDVGEDWVESNQFSMI